MCQMSTAPPPHLRKTKVYPVCERFYISIFCTAFASLQFKAEVRQFLSCLQLTEEDLSMITIAGRFVLLFIDLCDWWFCRTQEFIHLWNETEKSPVKNLRLMG